MSLKEINNNLIEQFQQGEYDIIIHQCNCFNNMGSGIARVIALQYPEAEAADKVTSPGDINKLGTYQAVETKDGIIINLYGQYGFGSQYGIPTSYMALRNALKEIARKYKGKRIGTYQLGCNRGGADWNIVRNIMANTICHQNDVTIVNYQEK